jgi:hypothetical protein
MDSDNPKAAICCCCTLTALVAVGALVFFSYTSLDASEYGLDYNGITKTIDSKYYGSGFHYLGFGHSFLRYPSTSERLDFSKDANANSGPIDSRTSDGLQI